MNIDLASLPPAMQAQLLASLNAGDEQLAAAAAATPFVLKEDVWTDAVIVKFATSEKELTGECIGIGVRPVGAPADFPLAFTYLSTSDKEIEHGEGQGSRWEGATNVDKTLDILDFNEIDENNLDASIGKTISCTFRQETYKNELRWTVSNIAAAAGQVVVEATLAKSKSSLAAARARRANA